MSASALAGAGLLAFYVVLALAERVAPGRPLPPDRGWARRAIAFLVLGVVISGALATLLRGWLSAHRLFDAASLGTGAELAIGLLASQVTTYASHRLEHRFDALWRWTHQLHHSAERTDVHLAGFFHPLDVAVHWTVQNATLFLVVGVSRDAGVAIVAFTFALNLFQHANVRTPVWLGYLVQRPEAHAVHHERGVHAFNYADLPLVDLLFGTFRNPSSFGGEAGFHPGASRRVGEMLVGRDVTQPDVSPGATRVDLAAESSTLGS